jgi:transketolase
MSALAHPATSPYANQPVKLMADAIRVLAMDAVQQANSGHPGAPMGMADMAVALWGRHLKHNPVNPHWPTATASCCPTATARC